MEITKNKYGLLKFNLLAASVLLSLPAMVQAASVSMPGGQIVDANGVPVININTANNSGLSHNVYDQFNVDKPGLVFNNSVGGADTVLAGTVSGNSRLTTGAAKIILNEVTSKNKSVIDGNIEVAGAKAQVIIANPNGITVNNSGFINTEKTTLTTGTPDVQQGVLKGFSVASGTVTVKDIASDSPTEILARSVVVDGNISAGELAVVAGNNYVNTEAKAIGTVTGKGAKNAYGIDISRLGGMYANRISLISTENGVGVRNAGVVAGGTKGIDIDNYGRLVNSGAAITSQGTLAIRTNGTLENNGGAIQSKGNLRIDTIAHAINNHSAGNIVSLSDAAISSGAFNNSNGKLLSNGSLIVDTNKQTLSNSGTTNESVIQASVVMLNTGTLNNSKGKINGNYVIAESTAVNNNNGVIDGNLGTQLSSSGNIDNSRGLIHSQYGQIQIAANKAFTNRDSTVTTANGTETLGVLAENGDIIVTAGSMNNTRGMIASAGSIGIESNGTLDNAYGNISANGNVIVESAGAINNYKGQLQSNNAISLHAASLDNSSHLGIIHGKNNVVIELSGTLDNATGLITSTEGDVAIRAKKLSNTGGILSGNNVNINGTTVDNRLGLITANNKLMINATGDVDNRNGFDFAEAFGKNFNSGTQQGGMYAGDGIDITAKSLKNNYSSMVTENGALSLNVNDDIINDRGYLASLLGSTINAKQLRNHNGTILSIGDVTIDVDSLLNASSGLVVNNTAAGIITSAKKIDLMVNGDFTNTGWISANEDVTINVAGQFINNKSISSDKTLAIRAVKNITNNMNIIAGTELTVETEGSLVNSVGSNISGAVTTVNAGVDITNRGNLAASDQLNVNAGRNLNNTSNVVTYGYAAISAKNINNSGNNALLGGSKGLTLEAERYSGTGGIVGY